MELDRLLCEPQLTADLRVRAALGNEAEDFLLARGEQALRRGVACALESLGCAGSFRGRKPKMPRSNGLGPCSSEQALQRRGGSWPGEACECAAPSCLLEQLHVELGDDDHDQCASACIAHLAQAIAGALDVPRGLDDGDVRACVAD